MPICENTNCNAEIQILAREPGPTGRKRYIEVDAKPAEVWGDLPGGAKVIKAYTAHRCAVAPTEAAKVEE